MKKLIGLIVCFLCIVSMTPVYASTDLKLSSQYAYLVDPQTNLVYLDQKSEEKIYPASMTKILTVSLALEKITDIHAEVCIQQIDLDGLFEAEASVAGFYVGEKVTYEDLLYGALLPSGADACQALARLTYGDMESFVKAMNQKVESLGLKHTHFMNVTGLHDDQHYTTLKDMSMILEHALKNEEFVKIFETRTYQDSKKIHIWNSSLQRAKLQKNIDITHIDGAKSGFTDEAQLTLASTMTIYGHQLILVTAYAQGQYSQNHVKDAVAVYQYMNNHYHDVLIYQQDEQIHNYWIFKTFKMPYHYKASEDIALLLDNQLSFEDLEISLETKSFQIAPLSQGKVLGKVVVKADNQVIYEYPMILTENVSTHIGALMIIYGFLVFILLMIVIKLKKKKR